MSSVTKTYTDNEYDSSTYKKTWTVTYAFNDITVNDSTFDFVTPSITAKFVGTSALYRLTQIITNTHNSSGKNGFTIDGFYVEPDAEYRDALWCWSVPLSSSSSDSVKGTSNSTFTISKDTRYYGSTTLPHTYTLNTADYFKSSNNTKRTLNVIGYFLPFLRTDTKSDLSGVGSVYDGESNITIGTVTLDAPPTFTLENIDKDTSDYYAGITTVSVPVTSISAKYGGYITKIELVIGSQTSIKEFTESSQPSSTETMQMLLGSAGSFRPKITVTDSRGQTKSLQYPVITIIEYTSPSASLAVIRTDANGKIEDEGTSVVVTTEISYTNDLVKLNQPTIKVDGTTRSTIWYTSWNGTYSSGNLSGAVNWTNYNPSSPVTLYGLVGGTFNPNDSYVVGITPSDTLNSGVETTQTVPPAFYTIDFKAGGKEIAFGAPANDTNIPSNGLFKCDMDFNLQGVDVLDELNSKVPNPIPNDAHIYGTLTDDSTNSLLTISTSNNCVVGHGGYVNENGNTNVYGNSVYLRSKTGIKFEGSTSSNININDLYVKTTHTVTTSLSVTSDSYKSGTATFSKANYLPVAMVGWHVSNGSGSGGTYALPYSMYLSTASAGSATLSYGFRAVGGAVSTCTLAVDILWKRII